MIRLSGKTGEVFCAASYTFRTTKVRTNSSPKTFGWVVYRGLPVTVEAEAARRHARSILAVLSLRQKVTAESFFAVLCTFSSTRVLCIHFPCLC
jgi:hypothetical protein